MTLPLVTLSHDCDIDAAACDVAEPVADAGSAHRGDDAARDYPTDVRELGKSALRLLRLITMSVVLRLTFGDKQRLGRFNEQLGFHNFPR